MTKYYSTLTRWARLFQNTKAEARLNFAAREPLTIVVTLHNEERNVVELVNSLAQQPFGIVFVVDHCDDATESKLKLSIEAAGHTYRCDPAESESNDCKFIILNNTGERGKKHALRLAVEFVNTQYVLCTDADCQPSAEWAQTVVKYIKDDIAGTPAYAESAFYGAELYLMPVAPCDCGNFVYAYDMLALQMVTACTAIEGRPTMANGANICFRRDLFLSHNPHTEYASGDDMFLLHWAKANGRNVKYIKDSRVLVRTRVPSSLRAFLRQHARWFRKSAGYQDGDTKNLLATVALNNAAWPLFTIGGAIVLAAGSVKIAAALLAAACVLFAAKTVSEHTFLRVGGDFFGVKVNVFKTMVFAVLYPFMSLAIVLRATALKRNDW